jgi:hypothetical protein
MISGRTKRIIREAIGIKLHTDNIKTEEGSSPSMSVKHPLQAFKERKKAPFAKEM